MSTAASAAAAVAAASAADWQNKLLRADKIHADLRYIYTYTIYIHTNVLYILVALQSAAGYEMVFMLHRVGLAVGQFYHFSL